MPRGHRCGLPADSPDLRTPSRPPTALARRRGDTALLREGWVACRGSHSPWEETGEARRGGRDEPPLRRRDKEEEEVQDRRSQHLLLLPQPSPHAEPTAGRPPPTQGSSFRGADRGGLASFPVGPPRTTLSPRAGTGVAVCADRLDGCGLIRAGPRDRHALQPGATALSHARVSGDGALPHWLTSASFLPPWDSKTRTAQPAVQRHEAGLPQ